MGAAAGAAAGPRARVGAGGHRHRGQGRLPRLGHVRRPLSPAPGAPAQGRAPARVGPRAAAELGHGPGGAQHRVRAGGGGRQPRRGGRRVRVLRVQPVSAGLAAGLPARACPDAPFPTGICSTAARARSAPCRSTSKWGSAGGGRPEAASGPAHPSSAPQAEDLPPGQHLPQPRVLGQRRGAAR